MRRKFLFGLALLMAAAAQGANDAKVAEWKRETREKQAAEAKAFAPLMESVNTLEVFVLDAASGGDEDEKRAKDKFPRLDRWKIIRQITVNDAWEIARLREGIKRSIETGGGVSPCFEPRHGIRFIRNGQPVELILCFECSFMQVNGSPDFEGVAISPVASTDFYRVFRAHGFTKPSRLSGMSDEEVAKRLAGTWTSAGTSRNGKAVIEGTHDETFAADGRYRTKGRTTIRFDGGQHTQHERDEVGRWWIKDGMLFILPDPSEDIIHPVPIEYACPVLEITPDRIVLCTTSVQEPGHESVWLRK